MVSYSIIAVMALRGDATPIFCGDRSIQIDIDEFLDMKCSVKEIAKSASRGLGALYDLFKMLSAGL